MREGRRTFANIRKYVMMGTSSNFGNMFSMAGGVLFLPFLPMLPVQILLNNLLYDISEIAIPMDEVDADIIAAPRHWDIKFVRDFMLVLGPVSSLFDFVTFGVLLWLFHASETLFHTGWFVESLATQCLVILVIRTRGNPLKSHPSRLLVAMSVGHRRARGAAALHDRRPLVRLHCDAARLAARSRRDNGVVPASGADREARILPAASGLLIGAGAAPPLLLR